MFIYPLDISIELDIDPLQFKFLRHPICNFILNFLHPLELSCIILARSIVTKVLFVNFCLEFLDFRCIRSLNLPEFLILSPHKHEGQSCELKYIHEHLCFELTHRSSEYNRC